MTNQESLETHIPLAILRHVRKNYLYAELKRRGKLPLAAWTYEADIPEWWTKEHFNQAIEDLLREGLATIDSATLDMSLAPQPDFSYEEDVWE